MLPDDFDPRDPLTLGELCTFLLVCLAIIVCISIYAQLP